MTTGEARRTETDQPDFAGELLVETLRIDAASSSTDERGEKGLTYRRTLIALLSIVVALALLVKCVTDVKRTFIGDVADNGTRGL